MFKYRNIDWKLFSLSIFRAFSPVTSSIQVCLKVLSNESVSLQAARVCVLYYAVETRVVGIVVSVHTESTDQWDYGKIKTRFLKNIENNQ